MTAGINIGGSIEIGGGISFGPAVSLGSSFTITSSDISNPQLWFSGYSSYSSTGFTSDGGTQLYNGLRYDITFDLLTRILDAQTAAGFDPGSAWVWQAAFATGGTVLVRLGLVNGLRLPRLIKQIHAGKQVMSIAPRYQAHLLFLLHLRHTARLQQNTVTIRGAN